MIHGKTEFGDYWQGVTATQICLDVPGMGFLSYPDLDTAVNTLYVSGHKELARVINKAFKGARS